MCVTAVEPSGACANTWNVTVQIKFTLLLTLRWLASLTDLCMAVEYISNTSDPSSTQIPFRLRYYTAHAHDINLSRHNSPKTRSWSSPKVCSSPMYP